MNGFVRKLAVLSVLWALCELILPDGKQQPMVRMTVSVLVMTALLGSVGQLFQAQPEASAFSAQVVQKAEGSYRQTALRAAANQVQSFCVRQASRAGYEARAAVWMGANGAVERIRLTLPRTQTALVSPEQLRELVADQLGIDASLIDLEEP